MNSLSNKKILVVICGGISAYKSLELIRGLKKKQVEIKTIITKSAKEFVTPLSITSLSQGKVYEDLFSSESESEMDHISLSRWADLIVVVPATANTISKLSNGLTDDLASTVLLASNKKIFIVPAMNVRMWDHPSNKKNIIKLREYGYSIIGPEIGDMACGEYGEGKMTEPSDILLHIENYLSSLQKNKKYKALVTAGPTREYLDPVRYLTNKSSGKQGYEIAKSFRDNGFETTLISGITNLKPLEDIKFIEVETADEMLKKTIENLPVDVAVFSAAVCDYKFKKYNKEKIKKNAELDISMIKNTDILSYVSKHNSLRPKLTVGFAAETENLDLNAKDKLSSKNCDWIIANNVSDNEIGFDSEYNEVKIFYKNNKNEILHKMNKSLIAENIVERVIKNLN
ncbi:bifunctional phosphopantothenoylcysteine decarboxylase/phosphopantothenate--cysteine ligase CoaBC [Candidatus Pelagibacter sp. RS40]|uniref:bifunctional phosphopantothenoylcysteine decarboxylase/phosphopantothenate--cysteine ligase CoaBC n=1 Tax=Candidatus Pelagibacter sp. RS40 TaxID=1977865 RepID=UPI000A15E657|nr:bifunctional phosphopantothenoylcysteine decarboxylase/phosphopantothenate--cysteine ligase CoaBC [Candidatus Pelagibacter sp. RS40]ARJ49110.1 phosphopantothenate synthase [Candidatus Pelagibacter sp. RS40]